MNKQPKNVSYGIIVYKMISEQPYYCLICRRDSFTYSEFVRGKYQLEDVEGVRRMISYMTEAEQDIIRHSDFETLWNKLWQVDKKRMNSPSFIKDFTQSRYKFDTLKKGYYTTVHLDLGKREKQFIQLEIILNTIEKKGFIEPEWGFPKGKKNKNESPIDCAKRELLEETNIDLTEQEIDASLTYEERYIGDNLIEYIHLYYIAECETDLCLEFNQQNIHQVTEISNIKWLTYEECMEKIRPYSTEKREILGNLHDRILNKNIITC